MWKLVAAALLLGPLCAVADVIRVTCPNDVYEINRDALTATSANRPGIEGQVNLIGRNLVEVLWTYPDSGQWEHEIIALHILSKMTTGPTSGAPPEKYTYTGKEKCLKRETVT